MAKSSRDRLIIMAHTDDPELSSGGSIAQWTQYGNVNYIITSSGEKGTWDKNISPYKVALQREEEAKKAAQFLGVKKVIFLRHPDGTIDEVATLPTELATLIRHLKPYTIVTYDPWSRWFHPDHRATAWAVIKSVMIARDVHFAPFLLEIGLKPHRPEELLLTPTDEPTLVNDITKTFEKKIAAIKFHESQLPQLPDWERRIKKRAKIMGEIGHYDYGEGFYQLFI